MSVKKIDAEEINVTLTEHSQNELRNRWSATTDEFQSFAENATNALQSVKNKYVNRLCLFIVKHA